MAIPLGTISPSVSCLTILQHAKCRSLGWKDHSISWVIVAPLTGLETGITSFYSHLKLSSRISQHINQSQNYNYWWWYIYIQCSEKPWIQTSMLMPTSAQPPLQIKNTLHPPNGTGPQYKTLLRKGLSNVTMAWPPGPNLSWMALEKISSDQRTAVLGHYVVCNYVLAGFMGRRTSIGTPWHRVFHQSNLMWPRLLSSTLSISDLNVVADQCKQTKKPFNRVLIQTDTNNQIGCFGSLCSLLMKNGRTPSTK